MIRKEDKCEMQYELVYRRITKGNVMEMNEKIEYWIIKRKGIVVTDICKISKEVAVFQAKQELLEAKRKMEEKFNEEKD